MASTDVVKEPNPPAWPRSVYVVEPDDKFEGDKQALFDSIFSADGKYSVHPPDCNGLGGYFNELGREFDSSRTAVLLKPGHHDAKFNVGYYTSLLGLGRHPGLTKLQDFEVLNGAKRNGDQQDPKYPGALYNCLRSVENLRTAPGHKIHYYVSQGAPLRKVHVQGQLQLSGPVGNDPGCFGYAAGGFMADCSADLGIQFGSQQEWIARNTDIGEHAAYQNGAWSTVLIGCRGTRDKVARVTDVESAESIAEKPYVIFEDAEDKYFLMVPQIEAGKAASTWKAKNWRDSTKVDFENVYVADAESSTAATINAKLAEGKHVVMSPGIYKIIEPIVVSSSKAVILGLGMATVQPHEDALYMDSLIFVQDGLEDVRIAGLVLQAGKEGCHALLKWGTLKAPEPEPNDDDCSGGSRCGKLARCADVVCKLFWTLGYWDDEPAKPEPKLPAEHAGFIYDLFCRVGGGGDASQPEVWANKMVQINSPNVVGDNLWLWRGCCLDGSTDGGAAHSRNRANNALEVNGDKVTIYGLTAEHALQDQVVWNGQQGKTYFFQCKLPYDATQQTFVEPGYSGYVVADHVETHDLRGAGVYFAFKSREDIQVASAFRAPEGVPGLRFSNLFTVFLGGTGGIEHVLNKQGGRSSGSTIGQPQWLPAQSRGGDEDASTDEGGDSPGGASSPGAATGSSDAEGDCVVGGGAGGGTPAAAGPLA